MNTLSALGDPTRQRIIEMLLEGELSAGAISENFNMSAPAISQHLKVLKQSNLVRVRIDGQRRLYTLDPDGFNEAAQWLNRIRQFWSAKLDKLELELTKETLAKKDEQKGSTNE